MAHIAVRGHDVTREARQNAARLPTSLHEISPMKLLAPRDYIAQPWKNGLGITHEIVRWPASAPADRYDVRISLAQDRVAAPFSRFPGYRRWSYLAAPAPISLIVDGVRHELRALGDCFDADGTADITCELPEGPTQLLSVLIRHGFPARPGCGAHATAVRFAYALRDLGWLPEGHAAVIESPECRSLEGAIWLEGSWPATE